MITKTLEKIISLVSSGFSFPKKEIKTYTITPTSKQYATYSIEGGYTTESGSSIPTRVEFFGRRDYYTSTGEYLFTESLPVWGSERRACYPTIEGWSYSMNPECGIQSNASPAKQVFEATEKTLAGKLFWRSYKFIKTEITTPSSFFVYKGSKGSMGKGLRTIRGGIK